MRITLNGETREVAGPTLALALEELGYGGAIVATAVNGTFATAAARPALALKDGDAVEVLAPMQGG